MDETVSIHELGSEENPFSLQTNINQALRILQVEASKLNEDKIIYFEWQFGIYTMNAGCQIEHKYGASHALEMLREEMKVILDK